MIKEQVLRVHIGQDRSSSRAHYRFSCRYKSIGWKYHLAAHGDAGGAQGQLDGVAVVQNFYLVAAPGGEQVVVAVTMTPKQADKLGARDLTLVGSLELTPAK